VSIGRLTTRRFRASDSSFRATFPAAVARRGTRRVAGPLGPDMVDPMSIPPTDADGLAKFLAGDVDTFFGNPGGLRISAAPAKNDAGISTSPPPNSNDNPPPHQHPACVRIAELRLSLEAPAPGDQIRPPSGKSRVLLAGSALLLAAVIALGLAGAAVVKIVRVENPPVARAAVQSLAVAAQSPLNAGTADQASGTETTDKAPAAPSPLTALPVDESGGRAAMHRWYAERQSAINRAPSLRPAALHSPLPRPAAHSPWRPRRRPVTAAEFSDLLRTLAPPSVPDFGCPKSLGAACASSR
jgi:hypothetical protein